MVGNSRREKKALEYLRCVETKPCPQDNAAGAVIWLMEIKTYAIKGFEKVRRDARRTAGQFEVLSKLALGSNARYGGAVGTAPRRVSRFCDNAALSTPFSRNGLATACCLRALVRVERVLLRVIRVGLEADEAVTSVRKKTTSQLT
jgi:hypothetical protein